MVLFGERCREIFQDVARRLARLRLCRGVFILSESNLYGQRNSPYHLEQKTEVQESMNNFPFTVKCFETSNYFFAHFFNVVLHCVLWESIAGKH